MCDDFIHQGLTHDPTVSRRAFGLATAQELSRRGAKVVSNGRDEKTLAEAAASIGGEESSSRGLDMPIDDI